MRRLPLVCAGVLFAVAHTQGPLFFSNQNQYLLHAAAWAGWPTLAADWLANTDDPTPLFSAAIGGVIRAVGLFGVQAVYFAVIVGYFVAMVRITDRVPRPPRFAVVVGMLALTHAAVVRWASVQLVGYDYPWLLQCGLAGQYALGPGLQPSAVGGAMLLAAVAVAGCGRPLAAVTIAGLAATVHTTYLLTAAFFTLGVAAQAWRTHGVGRAAAVGGLALLVVTPVVAHSWLTFRPTDFESFAEAQNILAFKRIPHHTLIERWFDRPTWFTLGWMLAGLLAARRTPLFAVYAVVAGLMAVGTIAVWASGSLMLALFFPWRASAILVPVATALIVGRVAALRIPAWVGWLTAILAAVGGLVVSLGGLGYNMSRNELGLLAHVRDTATPGDVYLIPAKYPDLMAGPVGNPSATFVTPVTKKDIIPVDLQRFRLAGRAAIYVDFKSIPYKDADLIEWDRRLKNVEKWYANRVWDDAVIDGLRREGVTHVVAAADRDVSSPRLERTYADDAYRVYRVK